MNCPFCNAPETKVVDSRLTEEGTKTRRRRKCLSCDQRFTTFEIVDICMPVIVKSDGRREPYNRKKLLSGLDKACQKRPISVNQIEHICDSIEKNIIGMNKKEVLTKDVGLLMMNYLRNLDPVAYVRFASVYKTFKDVDEFVNDLKDSEKEILPAHDLVDQIKPGQTKEHHLEQ